MTKRSLAITGFGMAVIASTYFRLLADDSQKTEPAAQSRTPATQVQSAKPVTSNPLAARAVIDKYCVTCHNARLKTAGLLLDTMDIEHVGEHAELWEKVARKFRTGEM